MENKTQLKTRCSSVEKRGALAHIVITFLLAVIMLTVSYIWPEAEVVNAFVWSIAVMYSISGMELSKRISRFYE